MITIYIYLKEDDAIPDDVVCLKKRKERIMF